MPLEIALYCAEAIDLLEILVQKGTRMAISDVGVGAAFCEAALKGARLNVLINTKLMKDIELKQEIEANINSIVNTYGKKAGQILAQVENIMAEGV